MERIETKTPSGGDFYEFYPMDKNRNSCSKEDAEIIMVRELTKDGKLLKETIMVRDKKNTNNEKK